MPIRTTIPPPAPPRGQPQGLPLRIHTPHAVVRGSSCCILRPPGGGDGGFSTLFRPALKHRGAGFVHRAQLLVYAADEIRGKTGPAPSGALLFCPFSWAIQEKGQGNRGRSGVVGFLSHGYRNAHFDMRVSTGPGCIRNHDPYSPGAPFCW